MTLGVVAYDIADDRRRTRTRTLLEAYGVPVQASVFVIELSPARWSELARKLHAVVDRIEDDVRVWSLCIVCRGRAQVWCGPERGGPGRVVIV